MRELWYSLKDFPAWLHRCKLLHSELHALSQHTPKYLKEPGLIILTIFYQTIPFALPATVKYQCVCFTEILWSRTNNTHIHKFQGRKKTLNEIHEFHPQKRTTQFPSVPWTLSSGSGAHPQSSDPCKNFQVKINTQQEFRNETLGQPNSWMLIISLPSSTGRWGFQHKPTWMCQRLI